MKNKEKAWSVPRGLVALVAGFVWSFVSTAAAQNVLATIPIPTASAGQIAVNTALNKIYSGGGPNAAGSSLTVIDGSTFGVLTTINPSAGVNVDMKNDNIWTGSLFSGDVVVYAGSNNTQISSTSVGFCPASVRFDCKSRRMWVAAQCGGGNDPVWAFNADTLEPISGPIGSGGVMGPIAVNPNTGKLYVSASGISKEVNPVTFAVTTTSFGTVETVDSVSNRLFASSGNNLQIINGANDALLKTVPLSYAPSDMAANNALGHLYLTNAGGNFIEVRNQTAGKLLSRISLGSGNQPNSIAADSTRARIFVDVFNTSTNSWSLYVIEDLSTVRTCLSRGGCDY